MEAAQILDWTVDRFTPEHIKEIERCNKHTKEEQKTHYNTLAYNYEGLYGRMGWPDPAKVAEYCEKFVKNKDAKILDMGCGTGLVGKHLKAAGYTNIHGVDTSPVMLEEARKKDCYSELEELELGKADTFPLHLKNKFDVVVCAGLINNNHFDYMLLEEMTMCLKKDALAIFAARFSYLGEYWYNTVLREMEGEKRWKLLEK